MNEHEKLNYVEFPASDLSATKRFFESAFNWTFQDFGPEYTAFSNEGLDGGFFIERCDRCLGLFFDPGELEHVLKVSAQDVHEVDRQRLNVMIAEEYNDSPKPVKYIKCPACGTLMNRRIFGATSGLFDLRQGQ